ncbi:hypothetical protein X474_13260 [Dethiosulfatarculus sandiegensis]|uniref:Uncharacterized protein n=1 Tax=Dethiosulfatarculus sandiegensis TaxID=1429043 RepID=A0A0D2GET9_9BACT|nr:hypothetical protein X474_13260 [Dethiosulfatarculus sandiegensis]
MKIIRDFFANKLLKTVRSYYLTLKHNRDLVSRPGCVFPRL